MDFSIKKYIRDYSAPISTGILFGGSYIPFPPWALFFCLVPLWKSWTHESSLKKIFISGWLGQFIFTAIGFHWIANTTVEFGHLPWPIGIAALVLFCSVANLQIPLAGMIWYKLFKNRSTLYSCLGLALITVLLDAIYPQIFSWNFGYPWLWGKLPGYNFADLIGFQGLGAVTLIINALVLHASTLATSKKRYAQIFIGVVIFNLLGYLWSFHWPEGDGKLRVSIIQANIGNFEKFAAERNSDFRMPITQKYYELTRRSLFYEPTPDLILWPETAFPANLHETVQDHHFQSQFRTFISSIEKPLLAGGYIELPNDGPYYNSFFYFNKNGEILESYNKSHLLAFGEYLPGSEYFPSIKKLLPEVSDFGRGAGPSILTHTTPDQEKIKIGPQICYEGLFPYFSKELSNKGAQIFVNVTNDSWFGHTFEPYQHLYMTLARAIEFRRPLIRSTNTGITAVVTSHGKMILQSPQQVEWFATVDVPYEKNPGETFFARFGFYLIYAVCGIGLIFVYVKDHVRKY